MSVLLDFEIPVHLVSINDRFVSKSFRLTTAYRTFIQYIGAWCKQKSAFITEKPVAVFLLVKTRKDIDNVIKPILDGMQGNVFKNDRQVVQLHVRKEPLPKDFKCEKIRIRVREIEE